LEAEASSQRGLGFVGAELGVRSITCVLNLNEINVPSSLSKRSPVLHPPTGASD
jgi:hypothetical protein